MWNGWEEDLLITHAHESCGAGDVTIKVTVPQSSVHLSPEQLYYKLIKSTESLSAVSYTSAKHGPGMPRV